MRRLICCLLLCLAAPLALAALDLNTATETELDALPGVGPSRAKAIVEHRTKSGPFRSVDDLRNVKGIGDKTFAELKPLLTVGSASGTSSSARTEPSPVTPSAAPPSGFPWWIAVIVAIAAVAAWAVMRKRAAPDVVARPVSVPTADNVPTPPAPQPAASPRPVGGVSASSPVSPVRPAGGAPRPAGSAPAAVLPDAAPAHAPKPPAPPKPAGSR